MKKVVKQRMLYRILFILAIILCIMMCMTEVGESALPEEDKPESTATPEIITITPEPIPLYYQEPAPMPVKTEKTEVRVLVRSEALEELYSEAEKKIIAKVVYAEARGEPFAGQVAVAHVVINRYESGKFGKTVKKVAYAKHQFANGSRYTEENLRAVEEAIETRPLPTNAYFFQKANRKHWSGRKSIIRYCTIGNHTFYSKGEPKEG